MQTEAAKRASVKYRKSHIRRIGLDVQNEYFETVLKPAVDKTGETVNGFIKKAIQQRIEREEL